MFASVPSSRDRRSFVRGQPRSFTCAKCFVSRYLHPSTPIEFVDRYRQVAVDHLPHLLCGFDVLSDVADADHPFQEKKTNNALVSVFKSALLPFSRPREWKSSVRLRLGPSRQKT